MEPISTFNDLQHFMESWDEEITADLPDAMELPEFQIHPQDLQEFNNSSSSFTDSLLQTFVDDYHPENCHDPGCAYETEWSESFQETQDSNGFPACNLTCMTSSASVSTPCPECNTLLSMNAITSNVNYIPESINQVAPESMLFQEYQPVWQAQSGPLQNAQLASSERKRTTLIVDHNGVAMRFDGEEERFTAYYRPSYWTEDDSAVFLGEYPTFEEAKDAHNLVALLHEGPHAQMDLAPFTPEKYSEELKRWEGKHHVDLVCELRLRGRGISKDGSVNYKHVGRRRLKTGTIKYYSTVLLNDSGPSNTVNTAKPKRTFLQTFDNPEEAARLADEILVKQKGVYAWTNFPLTSYITSNDKLPLTFLPLSNNFRENLTHKRARDF